jgi:hypothetical protein
VIHVGHWSSCRSVWFTRVSGQLVLVLQGFQLDPRPIRACRVLLPTAAERCVLAPHVGAHVKRRGKESEVHLECRAHLQRALAFLNDGASIRAHGHESGGPRRSKSCDRVYMCVTSTAFTGSYSVAAGTSSTFCFSSLCTSFFSWMTSGSAVAAGWWPAASSLLATGGGKTCFRWRSGTTMFSRGALSAVSWGVWGVGRPTGRRHRVCAARLGLDGGVEVDVDVRVVRRLRQRLVLGDDARHLVAVPEEVHGELVPARIAMLPPSQDVAPGG